MQFLHKDRRFFRGFIRIFELSIRPVEKLDHYLKDHDKF